MKSYLAFSILITLPISSHAYVGPGAGMGAVAVIIAVTLGVILLAAGFLWYPLKRMFRKNKTLRSTAPKDTDN